MSNSVSETETILPPIDQHTDDFHIRNAESANWLVRRITEARAYRQRIELWAEKEIRRAEREEQFFLSRYGAELEQWARQQIATQHNRKSICLPAGTVGIRTEPKRLAVNDEPALLAWCRSNLPSAIQTIQRIRKNSVKDHIAATGEIPDGTDITGGREKFYIK